MRCISHAERKDVEMAATAGITAAQCCKAHSSPRTRFLKTRWLTHREIANRPAPGNANPLGTSYAHVLLAEDAIVNGMLKGTPPLAATSLGRAHGR